jgi:large subunit ribosomal protein L15
MITLSTLKNTPGARHRRKRVGRGPGSGTGKTCGAGHKGQMSRKGHKHKPGFEGGQMRLVRRIPKRGFNNYNRVEFTAINVAALDGFNDGDVVDVKSLQARGLAKQVSGGVKLLGYGEIGKKLTIQLQAFSASARSKVEAAGGACEVVKLR